MVSAHLKNISQIESSPQVEVNIKNIWNQHLVNKSIGGGYVQDDVTLASKEVFPDNQSSGVPGRASILKAMMGGCHLVTLSYEK